jgi:hypothetical protein
MDLDNIKQRLRSEFKRRKDEQYLTFQINIRDMCKDALDKLEEQESLIKEMKDAAADMCLMWHDYDAGEDAWEDEHKGRWVKISKKELARRKVALDSIKDTIRDTVRCFNEEFEHLTDTEKESIKSLDCLMFGETHT